MQKYFRDTSGKVIGCGPNWLELGLFGKIIRLDKDDHSFQQGMPVFLVIRPEAVKLLSRDQQNATGLLQGKVKRTKYLGSHIDYQLELDGNVFISVFDYNHNYPEEVYDKGDKVSLKMPHNSFHILPV